MIPFGERLEAIERTARSGIGTRLVWDRAAETQPVGAGGAGSRGPPERAVYVFFNNHYAGYAPDSASLPRGRGLISACIQCIHGKSVAVSTASMQV